jgi:hypothetical protein
MQKESAPGQDELELAAAMPMEWHLRAWIDLDHAAVEIGASDRIVNDETDLRTRERVRPRAPRRWSQMHGHRRPSFARARDLPRSHDAEAYDSDAMLWC